MGKSLQKFDNITFGDTLVDWYENNKRDLPWRKTTDPYKIWVSEIMLQQTKVDTVIDYYNRFLQNYPTIFDLAKADEQAVLKQWEGLGYYSRARNLHQAAKDVVAKYDGVVPSDPHHLGDLKGIGPYTRGAISSIAFHQPEPAVDGNVMRVLSRVLLITDNISDQRTRKRFEAIVRKLIESVDPSPFNQGLMELGAVICTPRKPLCLHCPVKTQCRALEVGEVEQLPVKLKKKKQRIESYIVLLMKNADGQIAVEQRPNEGLLANLWQFPMVDTLLLEQGQLEETVQQQYGITIHLKEKIGSVKHVFSHIIWMLDVHHVESNVSSDNLTYVSLDELDKLPFSVSQKKIKKMLQDK